MSKWTYIYGVVKVEPEGRTQHAKTFVLNEVLDRLPKVWGSEGDMTWRIFPSEGTNHSTNYDQFGVQSNLKHWYEYQTEYTVAVEGHLRDSPFEVALRDFSKCLCRLSKRVRVVDILVKVEGDTLNWDRKSHVFLDPKPYTEMYDFPHRIEGRYDERISYNFRYGDFTSPSVKHWPDRLVNLVPGGLALATERDFVLGNLEPEEYLLYENGDDHFRGIDPRFLEMLKVHHDRIQGLTDYIIEELRGQDGEN